MEKQTFPCDVGIQCFNVIKKDENNSMHFSEIFSLLKKRKRKSTGGRTELDREDGSFFFLIEDIPLC